MFMEAFELMSNVFYFPLVWFEKILAAAGMEGSRGIFFAAFTVLITSGMLLHPLRGSGSSDRARKKAGLKEPNKDSSPEGKAASDD